MLSDRHELAAEQHEQWWSLVPGGIVGIALGVLAFAQPGAVALALVYVVGAWAIVTGLLEIVAAIRLRDVISTEWLMGLSGALPVLFGIVFLYEPGSGALALVYLFGFYAVLARHLADQPRLPPARAASLPAGSRAEGYLAVALAWIIHL